MCTSLWRTDRGIFDGVPLDPVCVLTAASSPSWISSGGCSSKADLNLLISSYRLIWSSHILVNIVHQHMHLIQPSITFLPQGVDRHLGGNAKSVERYFLSGNARLVSFARRVYRFCRRARTLAVTYRKSCRGWLHGLPIHAFHKVR